MSYLPASRGRMVARPTFRIRRGLGDTLSTGTIGAGSIVASGTQEAYQAASLAELRNISAWQEQWVKKDEMQRWLQIIATVTIPLSAAVWRLIFRRGV